MSRLANHVEKLIHVLRRFWSIWCTEMEGILDSLIFFVVMTYLNNNRPPNDWEDFNQANWRLEILLFKRVRSVEALFIELNIMKLLRTILISTIWIWNTTFLRMIVFWNLNVVLLYMNWIICSEPFFNFLKFVLLNPFPFRMYLLI